MFELILFLVLCIAIGVMGYFLLRLRNQRAEAVAADVSFRTLADVSPAGMWRTDPQGRATFVNRAWEDMTGLTDGAWKGEAWAQAIHPADRERVFAQWKEAVEFRSRFRAEWRWQRPDGSSLWVITLGAPEFDDEGTLVAYVGLNIDIDRSKKLEADLKRARERAENAAASKSSFLANMSHEIRTPMNGVIGFTELLLASELDEEQRTQVQLIADSGKAMMRLLNDILDMAKIESGQLKIMPEPTDIRQKLHHCVKLLEPIAISKQLKLNVWVDDDVPDLLVLDRLRVRQIMLNLIGNAVKFTEHGGIDVETRVETTSNGSELAVTVIDTGIGIPREQLASIFKPFTQEDSSRTRRFGGTGLGLTFCRQLSEMMGGRISVESKQGVGTSFTVRLPLVAAETPQRRSTDRPSEKKIAQRLAGARVLIAEDHSINQQLIMAIIDSLNMDAVLAANGREAVEAVEQAEADGQPFDAVLMDMLMPEMDGLEATRCIREMGYTSAQLPIVALTANCYPDDIAACRQAGMQGHLGKPLTGEELARELSRLITRNAGLPAPGDRPDDLSSGDPQKSALIQSLEAKYHARKEELIDHISYCLHGDPEATDWGVIADELHKLAGVAANFGDARLGEIARRLQRALREARQPASRLEALNREWDGLRDAA